jgi:NAD(P)-dependent dehydrogenase (short-subunit alcohol dehydrogenase family)
MLNPSTYRAPPGLLSGRNILVTGAGDGIGRAAALGFAAHGATVVLLGRTQAKLESVYDAITASGAPEPVIQLMDLATADAEQCEALAAQIGTELGALHGLLHNAALLGPRTPIGQYPPRAWRELMAVNVEAAFLLTRALLPALEEAPDASIVFTTSSVGRRGRAYWGAYAVSKFAVEGLCQVLSEELAATSRVRVNCLNPGPVDTAMRRAAYPAEDPSRNRRPEALLPAYLYLMGPDSIGVTGRSLEAQGGD